MQISFPGPFRNESSPLIYRNEDCANLNEHTADSPESIIARLHIDHKSFKIKKQLPEKTNEVAALHKIPTVTEGIFFENRYTSLQRFPKQMSDAEKLTIHVWKRNMKFRLLLEIYKGTGLNVYSGPTVFQSGSRFGFGLSAAHSSMFANIRDDYFLDGVLNVLHQMCIGEVNDDRIKKIGVEIDLLEKQFFAPLNKSNSLSFGGIVKRTLNDSSVIRNKLNLLDEQKSELEFESRAKRLVSYLSENFYLTDERVEVFSKAVAACDTYSLEVFKNEVKVLIKEGRFIPNTGIIAPTSMLFEILNETTPVSILVNSQLDRIVDHSRDMGLKLINRASRKFVSVSDLMTSFSRILNTSFFQYQRAKENENISKTEIKILKLQIEAVKNELEQLCKEKESSKRHTHFSCILQKYYPILSGELRSDFLGCFIAQLKKIAKVAAVLPLEDHRVLHDKVKSKAYQSEALLKKIDSEATNSLGYRINVQKLFDFLSKKEGFIEFFASLHSEFKIDKFVVLLEEKLKVLAQNYEADYLDSNNILYADPITKSAEAIASIKIYIAMTTWDSKLEDQFYNNFLVQYGGINKLLEKNVYSYPPGVCNICLVSIFDKIFPDRGCTKVVLDYLM